MGANIETVEIGKINVKIEDFVKKGEILFEIITDKANFEIEAEEEGYVKSLNLKEGEELSVLDEVGFIGSEEEEVPELKKASKTSIEIKKIKITPAAKKLAKENNVDFELEFKDFEGIVKEKDVLSIVDKVSGNVITEEISLRKKVEIEFLSKSKDCLVSSVTIPVSYNLVKEKVDRISLEQDFQLKIGEYISHVVAKLLSKFRKLNAFYSSKINLYKDINLNMAIGFEEDLFIPVIQNADNISLKEFSEAMKKNIMMIFKKEILNESEGTFTVTDLSSQNISKFFPMISKNQSAILGICGKYDSVSYKNNRLIYDPKFDLVLVFDHRVINGKYASEFLNELKKELES